MRDWVLDETAENMTRNFGSGYPGGWQCLIISLMCNMIFTLYILAVCQLNPVVLLGADPETKSWLEKHQHSVFGFPSLVRFSWGTCTSYSKNMVEVVWSVISPHFTFP